jgi:hypothetical protein
MHDVLEALGRTPRHARHGSGPDQPCSGGPHRFRSADLLDETPPKIGSTFYIVLH